MNRKSRVVLTAGIGTALSLSMATSAVAAVTGLDIGSGSIESKGLIATIPLTVTCDVGGYYFASVSLRQTVQQRTVTGGDDYMYQESCTGEPQIVNMRIQPSPKPFKKGTAVATATVQSCFYEPNEGYYICDEEINVTEEIRLR